MTLEKVYAAAKLAREKSYSPYSNFKVGAALKINGHEQAICGCNVENASYGATICAERNALWSAVAENKTIDPEYIVVVTDTAEGSYPCALCLQVIGEFCQPNFKIYTANLEKITGEYLLKDLLPHAFNKAQLAE